MMANFLCLGLRGLWVDWEYHLVLVGLGLVLSTEGHLADVGPPSNPEDEHCPSVSANGPSRLSVQT